MFLEIDKDQQIDSDDPIYKSLIAGFSGSQGQDFIKYLNLNKARWLDLGAATLDALNISYGSFKLFFDMFLANTDIDRLHKVLMTPGGVIAVTLGSSALVGFACSANESNKEEVKNAFLYCRDLLKISKNISKGVRSVALVVSLFPNTNIKDLINPISIGLILLGGSNRVWMRQMINARKKMMDHNDKLAFEIQNLIQFTEEKNVAHYLDQIKFQSQSLRSAAYFSQALNGFFDGVYLYAGVLGLSTLSVSMLIPMIVICSFYTIACILTRLYEENDFQWNLLATETRCKIALTLKQIELGYDSYLATYGTGGRENFLDLIKQLETQRTILHKRFMPHPIFSILNGVRNGLAAYGVLNSILFFIAPLLLLAGTTLPAGLVVASVVLGLVFVIAFVTHALLVDSWVKRQKNDQIDAFCAQFMTLRALLENPTETQQAAREPSALLEKGHFWEITRAVLKPPLSLRVLFQHWLEILRTFFAGLSKGQKFTGFIWNALQKIGSDGHYHDNPIIYVLSFFNALIFGITLALKDMVKRLKAPPKEYDLTKKLEDIDTSQPESFEPESTDSLIISAKTEPYQARTSGKTSDRYRVSFYKVLPSDSGNSLEPCYNLIL